jgi:hypothetical protein
VQLNAPDGEAGGVPARFNAESASAMAEVAPAVQALPVAGGAVTRW